MTTLAEIRNLEIRLHSHCLEWSDMPLQNELLYLLDELQELHGELDRRDVPQIDIDGLDLNLLQRLRLFFSSQASRQAPLDPYGRPLEASLHQGNLL